MSQCDICKEDRPDILVTRPYTDPCDEKMEDCTGDCPEECCDCPSGRTSGRCVHYSGCETFLTRLKPGMTIDEALNNIEKLFVEVDGVLDRMSEEIENLNEEIRNLKNNKG